MRPVIATTMGGALELLGRVRQLIVVGISGNREKSAYKVPEYLQKAGYRIIPVNPRYSEILGERSYPSLEEVPPEEVERTDAVLVFRPHSEALNIVRGVAKLYSSYGRPWLVWFQPGTSSGEAVQEAVENGLSVVVGICIMETHRMMGAFLHS